MVNQYSKNAAKIYYAAVTRSQRSLIMCGDAGAFQSAANSSKRATFLQEFLTNFDIE